MFSAENSCSKNSCKNKNQKWKLGPCTNSFGQIRHFLSTSQEMPNTTLQTHNPSNFLILDVYSLTLTLLYEFLLVSPTSDPINHPMFCQTPVPTPMCHFSFSIQIYTKHNAALTCMNVDADGGQGDMSSYRKQET